MSDPPPPSSIPPPPFAPPTAVPTPGHTAANRPVVQPRAKPKAKKLLTVTRCSRVAPQQPQPPEVQKPRKACERAAPEPKVKPMRCKRARKDLKKPKSRPACSRPPPKRISRPAPVVPAVPDESDSSDSSELVMRCSRLAPSPDLVRPTRSCSRPAPQPIAVVPVPAEPAPMIRCSRRAPSPDFARLTMSCSRPAPEPIVRRLPELAPIRCSRRREPSPPLPVLHDVLSYDNYVVCARQLEPDILDSCSSSDDSAPTTTSAHTVLYWDAIKVPSPACLGLPGSAVPSLSKLCIKSILDAGVYVRDHPSATPDIVKQIDDELLAFPFLDLADPRPADEWPAATMTALTQPLESDTLVPAINLGVDVIDCAGRIYDLVTASRGVDALGERANMVRAMARYEVFLGLVHDNPDATLVPALDILTVWYSHLIRTDKYKTYCMERWGREAASLVDRTGPLVVLDAFGKLLTDDDDYAVSEAVAATAALWAAATGGETYETNLAVLYGGGDGAVAPAPLSVVLARGLQPEEVIRDRDWVDDLHSMISAEKQGLLAAHDERHLRTLVRSYERFLYLNAKYPSSRYLSVALDVDLVWHAHQLFPSRYEQDCLRLFGVRIPHIPWPEHTAEEEVDNTATLEAAWLDAFGLPFGSRPQ